jgi:Transcriptional Coactivator p15 (PC4)
MAKKKDRRALAPNKSAQTKDILVAKWQATKRELVRVMVRHFKGIELIDVRRWYRDAQGQLCPGKGISFRSGDLKRLRRALREAGRLINGDR